MITIMYNYELKSMAFLQHICLNDFQKYVQLLKIYFKYKYDKNPTE